MLATLQVLFPLLVQTCLGSHLLDLQWISEPILFLLEDKFYCQVSLDFPDQLDLSLPNIESSHFTSLDETTDCSPTLIIKDIKNLNNTCNQRNHYVKNPQETFLYMKDQNVHMNLQSYCLTNQPFFFTLTKVNNQLIIEEVQVFSQMIAKVVELNWFADQWNINETSIQSWSQRRSNFHGAKVSAYFDDFEPFGYLNNGQFWGYNGELGTIVVNKLNLTLDLKPIKSYGVKLSNGSFTGTLEELQANKIDIAMASFNQVPERLEVSDGIFTVLTSETKIVFWKHSGSIFIFGMVFSQELWLSLFFILTVSSVYFFIDLNLHDSKGYLQNMTVAFVTNVKALFAVGHSTPDKALSIRFYLFSYGLCAAIIFWCYTGLLVSYFTAETEEQPIRSFQELASKPSLRLVLFEGAAESQPYFRVTKDNPKLESAIKDNIVWKQSMDQEIDEFLYGSRKQNFIMMVDSRTFYYSIFNSKHHKHSIIQFSSKNRLHCRRERSTLFCQRWTIGFS